MNKIDYATVKAMRSADVHRRLCAHEAGGHAFVARALGSVVEYVTSIPNEYFSGHCMRRGAPSTALALVADDAALEDRDRKAVAENSATEKKPAQNNQLTAPVPRTMILVDACAKVGSPSLGDPRIEYAEPAARAMTQVIELVAGRVAERVMFPDREPLPSEHDYVEARALASVIAAAPDALLRFAEAEAETLIRSHLGVVNALTDALVEHGTLTGEQVDQIIRQAMAAETLAAEYARRREMQVRGESAAKFREMTLNG